MKDIQYKEFRTFLIRAVYDFCMVNKDQPYLKVRVKRDDELPDFLRDQKYVVFDIHPEAVKNLVIADDIVSFSATFKSQERRIAVYPGHVTAIYGRDTNIGLPLPLEDRPKPGIEEPAPEVAEAEKEEKAPKSKGPAGTISFTDIQKKVKGMEDIKDPEAIADKARVPKRLPRRDPSEKKEPKDGSPDREDGDDK